MRNVECGVWSVECYPNHNPNTIEFDEFIIINEAGMKLEIKTL